MRRVVPARRPQPQPSAHRPGQAPEGAANKAEEVGRPPRAGVRPRPPPPPLPGWSARHPPVPEPATRPFPRGPGVTRGGAGRLGEVARVTPSRAGAEPPAAAATPRLARSACGGESGRTFLPGRWARLLPAPAAQPSPAQPTPAIPRPPIPPPEVPPPPRPRAGPRPSPAAPTAPGLGPRSRFPGRPALPPASPAVASCAFFLGLPN